MGVRLTYSELLELLSEDWRNTVLIHFKCPHHPGYSRVMETCEFRCVTIRECEPGLRISRTDGRQSYVILGKISCKTLFDLAPAIMFKMAALKTDAELAKGWTVRVLNDMKRQLTNAGPAEAISNEREAKARIIAFAEKMILGSVEHLMFDAKEIEFLADLMYTLNAY